MTVVFPILCIFTGSLILALAIGRGVRIADERAPSDDTRRPSYPPPVPAPRCRFEPDTPVWDDVDEISFRWLAEGSAR